MLFSHAIFAVVACAASVRAGYLSESAAQAVSSTHLGELESLEAFYAMLGTNESHWEDITEYETPRDAADIEQWRDVPPNTTITGLSKRDDYCSTETGFVRLVCDNIPDRAFFWTAGGAMLIYYLPRFLDSWLTDVGNLIITYRDVRQILNGPRDELRKRASWASNETNTNVHFTVPFTAPGVTRRAVAEDGSIIDTQHTSAYIYNTASGELRYHSTHSSFSVGGAPASTNATEENGQLDKRRTSSYTIVLHISRQSQATTTASKGCIASTIKRHLDDASEHNRFGCVPIDNQGSWLAALHININKGRNNKGTYGSCC